MSLSINRAGIWYQANEYRVKLDEQWVPVKGFWYKTMGRWVESFNFNKVLYVNDAALAGGNIYELMGSPTEPADYIFENRAEVIGNVNTEYSLRTGQFPEGSTLTIINKGIIRGRGGNGVGWWGGVAGQAARPALLLDYPTTLDNINGEIIAGGAGGSVLVVGSRTIGGGGGAGTPGGLYTGSMEYDYGGYISGTSGTPTTGGLGARFTLYGYVGYSGQNVGTGTAIKTNGHLLKQVVGNDPMIKGSVV